MQSRHKVPWLTIDAATQEINQFTTLLDAEKDPRKRVKIARRLAFAGTSLAFSKASLDLLTIDIGISALRKARRFGAITDDLNRSIAWLSKRKLEVSGCAKFEVTAEKKKIVTANAACLAASGNRDLDASVWTRGPETIVPAMNRGDFYLVATGFDGRYPVTLRMISAPEPVLNTSEYKHLECSAEVGVIRIENSELLFGAPENMKQAVSVAAPNGLLKVQLHYLSKPRGERFVLVGCSTNDVAGHLQDIPEIR